MVSNSFGGRGSGSPLLFITVSLQSLAYCNRGVQEMAEYSKGLYNTGIRTCNEAVVTTAYILTVQLSWGYSHILAIQVCAAGNGMVFKPF